MSQLDSIIFGKKTFSNILEEIYKNQKRREGQVTALISELKPLVQEIGDATLIVPLIKEYMEIGVKNDEQLIKMGYNNPESNPKLKVKMVIWGLLMKKKKNF